jgi:hypothetical protein
MTGKVTDLAAFKSRRATRDKPAAGPSAARQAEMHQTYERLLALLDETEGLVQKLDDGLQRDLSRGVALGRPAPRDHLDALIRGYERLSWRLHGQLRHILDTSRKY